MKRLAMIIVLSSGLIAGPAAADHNGVDLMNRENLGAVIGAAIGGFAGNKIVKGKGRPAATAAGAVGGFLLGKNIAHNYRNDGYAAPARSVGYSRAVDYGPSRSYTPTRSYRPAADYGRSSGYQKPRTCCDHDAGHHHRIHPIHATYIATCTSNVRSGPGTRYRVIDQLYDREPVRVIGKVQGRNWYKVQVGHRDGYVYAPLLRPTRYGYNDY